MTEERGLHLDRSDAVVGDLDDLVGAAAEPDITVLVDRGGVAGEVDRLAGNLLPVIARVSLGLRPEARGESWERPLDDEDALLARSDLAPVLIDDRRLDPGERHAAGPRLDGQLLDPVRIPDDRTAGLGLPVVVDHRDTVLQRLLLEPLPRRRVQHLACAEHALERREIVLARRLVAKAHEQTYRGR